jgi:hypothetical protein
VLQVEDIPIRLDDLHSVHDLAKLHPNILTVRALRWQLRHRDENGLGPACVRVGKKLLISGARYEHWLTKRAGA